MRGRFLKSYINTILIIPFFLQFKHIAFTQIKRPESNAQLNSTVSHPYIQKLSMNKLEQVHVDILYNTFLTMAKIEIFIAIKIILREKELN